MRVFRLLPVLYLMPLILWAGMAEAGEDKVELRNMAARVIIVAQARDTIEVKVRAGSKAVPQITVSRRGNTVQINGNMSNRQSSCGNTSNFLAFNFNDRNGASIKVAGKGQFNVNELPIVYVYGPRNLEVSSFSAVYGSVSDVDSLRLNVHGCGDWRVGPVQGELKVMSSGAGDIHFGNGGRTEIVSTGSGDIHTGSLRSLKVSQSGSGDIITGAIVESVSAAMAGSGDIVIASVNGPVEISLAGSGDLAIAKGRARTLKIAIAGSGDVHFGGEAANIEAAIVGSGDVNIARATGSIQKKVLGSGDVTIGH